MHPMMMNPMWAAWAWKRRAAERTMGRAADCQARWATGRRQGLPGFGRGGRGVFDEGDGGDGLMRGRKFSAEDLQLLLLGLLEAGPSHGYDLIKQLAARSAGFYSPSPGMVYPTLTWLEEGGLVTVSLDGTKKRYALSSAGREHLAAHRERLTVLWQRIDHVARKIEWMRRAWSGQGADGSAGSTWLPEFVHARQALKDTLMKQSAATPAEQQRIAALLREVARQIESGGTAAPASSTDGPDRGKGPDGEQGPDLSAGPATDRPEA